MIKKNNSMIEKSGICRYQSLYDLLKLNKTTVDMPYILLLGIDSFFTCCQFYYKQAEIVVLCSIDNGCDKRVLENLKTQYLVINEQNSIEEILDHYETAVLFLYMNWNKPGCDYNIAPIHTVLVYRDEMRRIHVDDKFGSVILEKEQMEAFEKARNAKLLPFQPKGFGYAFIKNKIIDEESMKKAVVNNLKKIAEKFSVQSDIAEEENVIVYRGKTAFEKLRSVLEDYANENESEIGSRLFRIRMFIWLKSFAENPYLFRNEYEYAFRFFGYEKCADIMKEESKHFNKIYKEIVGMKNNKKQEKIKIIINELNEIESLTEELCRIIKEKI